MPEARPFIGLMYDPAVAGSLDALTTPPYDVISAEDQERFHGESPYNVIRLILGRVYAVLVRPSSDALGAFLDEQTAIGPDLQLTDDAGTTHRVWVAATGWDEALQEIRNSRLMIADGHHRYTVALAHRDEMRARHGAGPWDAMMTMVVDAGAENPPVLPIHRVVMVGALPEAPRGDPVRDLAEVLATVSDDDLTLGVVAIEDGRLIHRIASLPGV